MNANMQFGGLGEFGMIPYGAYSGKRKKKKGKKRKKKRPPSIRQRLFDMFARQYGTSAFPAWSDERAQCIKQWLRKNAENDCVQTVRNMKQVEYIDWLKQGLRDGRFRTPERQAAKEILGRDGEQNAVEEKGRSDLSENTDGGGLEGGIPWGLMIGGAVVLGGGYWFFSGRK